MASFGHRLSDEEFVAYVLTGLDEEIYNSLVSSIVTRVEPISPSELYSQMLSYELRLEKQSGGSYTFASANAASRGHGSSWCGTSSGSWGHGRSCGTGRGSPSSGSRSGYTNNSNYRRNPGSSPGASGGPSCPQCQVCLKVGHTANVCWYRYDEDYIPENRVAATTSTSGTDLNWYLDSGATDHITGELEKLTLHDRYNGNDHIHAANGAGMDITHIGKFVMTTPSRPLHLNCVLHVPQAHKQLVSIHRFTLDNHTFIELHLYFFLIKDQATKNVLLRGPCRGGLYPLPLHLPYSTQKLILSTIKLSSHRWHYRLGHPSRGIILRVIKNNHLSCSGLASSESVCDACLHAKAHQLPFSRSSSQSTTPLELVFFDVCGPAIDSFGNKKYYVSFIDDFSKFTWLYLLRHKSDVLSFLKNSSALLNDCSITKY
jgi:hypothetical protein